MCNISQRQLICGLSKSHDGIRIYKRDNRYQLYQRGGLSEHHQWSNHIMSEEEKKIILITDLVDQRLRKEQEIEYYEKELVKIQERLGYLYKEKTLTETILAIIQTEKVVDIKEYMQAKLEKKE